MFVSGLGPTSTASLAAHSVWGVEHILAHTLITAGPLKGRFSTLISRAVNMCVRVNQDEEQVGINILPVLCFLIGDRLCTLLWCSIVLNIFFFHFIPINANSHG